MPTKSRGKSSSKSSGGNKHGTSGKTEMTSSSSSLSTSTSSSSVPGSKGVSARDANAKRTLVSKVFEPGYALSPSEVISAAHWIRQILAIIVGAIFGLMQLKGFPPVMTYCVLALTTPHTVLSAMHELDLDEIATKGSIQYEGFFPAAALFFLSWIISYTIFLPAAS